MDMISKMSGTSREVYERMKESNATYYNMYKLWSDATKEVLNENKEKSEEAYSAWKEDFRKNVLENYMAYVPDSIRGLSDRLWSLVHLTNKSWECSGNLGRNPPHFSMIAW